MGFIIVGILLFIALADLSLAFALQKDYPHIRFVTFMIVTLGLQYILYLVEGLNLLAFDTRITTPPLAVFALSFLFMFLWEYTGTQKLKWGYIILALTVPFMELSLFLIDPFDNIPLYHKIWQISNLCLTIIFLFLFVLRLQSIKTRKAEHKNLIIVSNLVFVLLCVLIAFSLGHHNNTRLSEIIIASAFDFIDFLILGFLYIHFFNRYKLKLIAEREKRRKVLRPLNSFHKLSRKGNALSKNKHTAPVSHNPVNAAPPDELQEMQEKITHFFANNESVYLSADFKLEILAEHTGISRPALSKVFSYGLHTTFNHYLNKYRIQHAQRLLSEQKDITVTDLTEYCGYKSRASFYKHFKIITGESVAEYKEALNE